MFSTRCRCSTIFSPLLRSRQNWICLARKKEMSSHFLPRLSLCKNSEIFAKKTKWYANIIIFFFCSWTFGFISLLPDLGFLKWKRKIKSIEIFQSLGTSPNQERSYLLKLFFWWLYGGSVISNKVYITSTSEINIRSSEGISVVPS